jgi:uncharacterized membrane protein
MKPRTSIAKYFHHAWGGSRRSDWIFTAVVILASVALAFLPTGYEKKNDHSLRAKALVLETWNDGVRNYGVLMQGEQLVRVRVLSGPYKGLEADANNIIYGKADLDKVFRPGDRALVVIDPSENGGAPAALTLVDHYRLDIQLILVLAFCACLMLYGGLTGLKSAVSFAFTVLGIWKLLIPAFLAGTPPVLASLGTVTILTFVIIFLVAGFTRTGIAAFLGSLLGSSASAILALLTAAPYRLNGAVRPFSETLRFGGFDHLDLTQIFLAGTFLASSGAFMDLATDISASLEEIHRKRPELSFKELALSGLSVGRKVIGTMSTTLLLAYTGSYTSLLMVFMAQGVPFENMFTMSYVSSEVFHTMMGSMGLLLVAPFTAMTAAALFTRAPTKNRPAKGQQNRP